MRGTTKSADDTRELAGQLAALARPGDVILLTGDLGAGKTTFAQGFGRAIGIDEPITSPTFTLVRQYRASRGLSLVHADLYRLDRLWEVVDLGLLELLDDDGVALIEWGEAATPALPADYLVVSIAFGPTDDDRILELQLVGAAWGGRVGGVQRALERWQ